MREYFILNGVDSRDFGVYISGQGTFSAPQKAYTFYNIPGRNGALLGNEHRLENITLSYEAFIYTDFDNQIAAFRSFLLSIDGYAKLTDSYHPDEYRMAVYQGPFEPTVEQTNDAGKFTITFSCKPQRFLTDGDTWYKWAGNYTYYTGEDITGNIAVDPSYMTVDFTVAVPTNKHPTPTSTLSYYIPPYIEARVNGEKIFGITKTDIAAASYNLVSGTGSVTQKRISAPTNGWTLSSTNTFRHSLSNVSDIKYCSHYSMSSSKQYYCYYSGGYVYIHDPDYSTANAFNSFMAIAWVNFTVDLTTPESVTFTSYTPSFSAPFDLSMWFGPNSGAVLQQASGNSSISVVANLRYFSQTTSSTMTNPTVFESQPLIRVYGNGSFSVNDITITITNATSYTDIDCEMMDCYEGSTNRNNDVAFSTYDFPVLKPGDNPVTIVSGITEVDIQPRWWRV